MADESSSIDPLTLPSSPLGARSARLSSVKPLSQRSPNKYSSPSKSFVMDTGKADGASPWRIRVTVEAEPQEVGAGSPTKPQRRRRTTKVPLKGLENSSSPRKKAPRGGSAEMGTELVSEVEVQRPQRKRKGTPIRRRTTRTQPARDEPTAEEDDAALMPPPDHIPTSSATKARRRRSLMEVHHVPNKRLSQAREELDEALQQAVGYNSLSDEDVDGGDGEIAGDMTVAGEEDFTMVSVETLESYKADRSLLGRGGDGDESRLGKSGLSVSYLPSSPPKKNLLQRDVQEAEAGAQQDDEEVQNQSVRYPNLSDEARQARNTPARMDYDVMSWKPTGAAKSASMARREEWQAEREAVSRDMRNAPNHKVSDHTTDAVVAAEEEEDHPEPQQAVEEQDADIWQEEASRSLEEDDISAHTSRPSRRSRPAKDSKSAVSRSLGPGLDGIFGDMPPPPRRSKIPRTWRRTSGVDFQYSDSPAHAPVEAEAEADFTVGKQRRDASTGGSSRASSGVLTPPSTDDEAHRPRAIDPSQQHHAGHEEQDESDISLTRPDAEATRLHAHDPNPLHQQSNAAEDVVSPLSDTSTSPEADGEDTGLFWQNNMPQVYQRPGPRPRPQRQKAMDLSDLLNLGKSSPTRPAQSAFSNSVARNGMEGKVREGARHSPLHMQPILGAVKSSPTAAAAGKAINSPLRRSLLRSSKAAAGGSPIGKAAHAQATIEKEDSLQDEDSLAAEEDTSLQSKASDQRQLLREMRTQPPPPPPHALEETEEVAYEDEEDYVSEDQDQEASYEYHEPSRSYEEHLNLDSPQKIRVNFNDSSLNLGLLVPKRQYAPLFGPSANTQQATAKPASPPTITLINNKPSASTEPGVLSRLSTTFWSAIVRPSGPNSIPANLPQPQPKDTVFPPSLAAQIRNRYGVLSAQHPWTMAHMRTLHRMHNSCLQHNRDSIIPKKGPLPSHLNTMIGKTVVSIAGNDFTFTTQHAHVVFSFMQVLVPPHVVQAMERGEIERLGDKTAMSYHDIDPEGRAGTDLVWGPKMGVHKSSVKIESRFVVRALGDVLAANKETERREREAAAKARARMEYEVDYEDQEEREYEEVYGDEEGYEDGESEVLQKVRHVA